MEEACNFNLAALRAQIVDILVDFLPESHNMMFIAICPKLGVRLGHDQCDC